MAKNVTERAVLSVDFELFNHTPAYRNAHGTTARQPIGLDAWPFLRSVFDDQNAVGTFFVVSDVAERHPETIQEIAAAGHEIGSHTHNHSLLSTLGEAERQHELTHSREILERVTGERVEGFRAPAFDITPGLYDALAAAGYAYDSSVAPTRSIPGWYGGEYVSRRPTPAAQIESDAPDQLTELPIGVMPGLRLPLTGTWIRFFGVRYTIIGMKLIARRGIIPILYVHPWELVELPPMDGVPNRVYWRTGAWMRRAIARLLDQPFDFVTARTVLESVSTNADGKRTEGALETFVRETG